MATAISAAHHDLERSVEKIRLAAEAAAEEARRGSGPIVHSQVRRIREEDLRIGDNAGEGLRGARAALVVQLGTRVGGAILCSPRPWMLPCSPLGNKAAAM